MLFATAETLLFHMSGPNLSIKCRKMVVEAINMFTFVSKYTNRKNH